MKGESTVAAGRLQGRHDAMATASISNLISSLLFHLSLLNPEAGNVLIWKEHKMACGCYAYSNGTLPNGPDCHKGNLATHRNSDAQGPPRAFIPDVAKRSPRPGASVPACLPAVWQPASGLSRTYAGCLFSPPRGFWGEYADRGRLADPLGDLLSVTPTLNPSVFACWACYDTGTQPAWLSG